MSVNAIRKNKILSKISRFTVSKMMMGHVKNPDQILMKFSNFIRSATSKFGKKPRILCFLLSCLKPLDTYKVYCINQEGRIH